MNHDPIRTVFARPLDPKSPSPCIPSGASVLSESDGEQMLISILSSISPFGTAEHVEGQTTLLSRFAQSLPPISPERIPHTDCISTAGLASHVADLSITAVEDIVRKGIAGVWRTAHEYVSLAQYHLKDYGNHLVAGAPTADFATWNSAIGRLKDVVQGLGELGMRGIKEGAMDYADSLQRTVAELATLELRVADLQEHRWEQGDCSAKLSGKGWREIRQELIDRERCIPKVEKLSPARMQEYDRRHVKLQPSKADGKAAQAFLNRIWDIDKENSAAWLVTWSGDCTPFGLCIDGRPVKGMQNGIIGDGNVIDGVTYERVQRSGGESGKDQQIIIFAGTTQAVSVDEQSALASYRSER